MFHYDLGGGAELRILERRHAPDMLKLVAGNRDYIGRWVPWGYTMVSVEQAEEFIAKGLERFYIDGLPRVGIWRNQELVGGILFFPVEQPIRATEVGYWLGEQASGQGLMTRAVRAMLRFVFDDLQLNRVVIQTQVENTASRAVAERLGFTLEGIRRQVWLKGDQLVDLTLYALLAAEWRAQQ